MARRGVQHWKKRKAIAAYLFRRRWWDIKLNFSDSFTLTELVNITAPATIIAAYADSFSFTEDLRFSTALTKTEIVDILEEVSLSVARDLTTDSFGFSETLSANFDKTVEDTQADGVTFSEQLDILFRIGELQDSVGITETYSHKLTKVLVDGFAIDDTTIVLDKEVIFNKQNVVSFATDIHSWNLGKGLSDTLPIDDSIGITIFKTFTEDFVISENINSKEFTLNKSDGVIADHSETADVAISGTFANRKLGGEPFNKLTFN